MGLWTVCSEGYVLSTPLNEQCGYRISVLPWLPKPERRVRLPLPAPISSPDKVNTRRCYCLIQQGCWPHMLPDVR